MHAVGQGGMAAALSQMAFGNDIGLAINDSVSAQDLFDLRYGSILVETDSETAAEWATDTNVHIVATTTDDGTIKACGVTMALRDLQSAWEEPLSTVFPIKSESARQDPSLPLYTTYGRNGAHRLASRTYLFPFARERTVNTTRQPPSNGLVRRRISWSFAMNRLTH